MKQGVHISIHDVSPAYAREVSAALEMAHGFGIKPALLVVPDYHGRAPLLSDRAFCDRLVALEREGHEVYLHGYYHRAREWSQRQADTERDAPRGGRVRRAIDKLEHTFAQSVVSAGEAEFKDVTREEAEERLDAGETMLHNAGLTIRGFVAPAWSMPAWMLPLLGSRGYTFTEDHMRVYDPAAGTSRASVVLNYASRTPARLFSSVAWCRLAKPAARVLPARLAIHPADMRFALLRGEIERMLRWAQGRAVETGHALLS